MRRRVAATLGLALVICALAPTSASAGFNPLDAFCTVAGDTLAPKWLATGCKLVAHPRKVLGIVKKVVAVGKKLGSGQPGGALETITGGAGKAAPALGLASIVTWVLGGAAFALHETATLLGKTTNPELGAAWFSSTYLHMAAIATLLTLPFLFAAAVQSLMRSDLAMLARAAFGYLPLAMLAIGIAIPLTTLLLAASDGLSGTIEQAAGGQGTAFLVKSSVLLGGLTALAHSPFVAFLIGFFVAAGALVLWLELVLREVAVYVIVLTLPIVFAAFVWPARRVWAIRAVEVLVALILAKLAIVSVLALGAGALDHATKSASIVSLVAGIALVTLGAFAPWVLVKLMPLGELAAAAAGPLRGQFTSARQEGQQLATPWAAAGTDQAENIVAGMRRMAMAADPAPEGADAEAARLDDLGSEPGSREPGSAIDGVGGVTGGENPDPLRGTAGPPGGPVGNAPGSPPPPDPPGAPGAPPPPAPPKPDTECGPAPKFTGFEGAEEMWQGQGRRPVRELGPDWRPTPPLPADDDPRPPTQEPEDGRL
ncbi:MAG TPA: hypothetical protein VG294_01440 [Solirubrobacteraceae bacterium]|jgi:hypothetical protein|nr:hypothetical protein [Solirubrobacteraceae bacterium]